MMIADYSSNLAGRFGMVCVDNPKSWRCGYLDDDVL